MQRYFVLASVLLIFIASALESSAKEWIIFYEELAGDAQTAGNLEPSAKEQFEGDTCLKYTGAGLAWAGITGLNFNLEGIVYDDAFLEFYVIPDEAPVTLEIRLLGPDGAPDMGSRVHPQLEGLEYTQIKIPLRHFLNRATSKIPKSLDDFTNGSNIVDQFMIAATGDQPIWIDNMRIADTEEGEEQRSVSPSGKLATSWAKLKVHTEI